MEVLLKSNVLRSHLGSRSNADSESVGLGWGPGFSTGDKLPDEASGPGTGFYVGGTDSTFFINCVLIAIGKYGPRN